MIRRWFGSTTGAVLSTINELLDKGKRVGPRGQGTIELTNYGFTVGCPTWTAIRSFDEEHNRRMEAYLEREFELYDTMEFRAAEFAKGAKLWEQIANPDGTVNSAYGFLIFGKRSCGNDRFHPTYVTPWEWAKARLLEDRDTRQAYVRISLPEHQWQGVKDLTCTMHLMFLIRDGQLDVTCVMRSQDATRGLPYDLPYFCRLLYQMAAELRATKYSDLQVGEYHHLAHSMHLYDSELQKAKRMVARAV